MSYIETLAPRGYDPHALFVYPYQEGIRNLRGLQAQPTVFKQIKHCVAGILLLIPLINTVAFVILRELTAVHVFHDRQEPIHLIEQNETAIFPSSSQTGRARNVTRAEPPRRTLHQVNQERNAALSRHRNDASTQEVKEAAYAQIQQLEGEAVNNLMRVQLDTSAREHLYFSQTRDARFVRFDGRIFGGTETQQTLVTQQNLPSAVFSQIGGVDQFRGDNHLCGYYALFYMYQAVTGNRQFASRDALHPMLEKWMNMIAKKRALNWVSTHREENIPYGLRVSVRGLSRDDMQYLIQNDETLAPLLQTNNCFVMEMDEYQSRKQGEPYTQPITPLGNKTLVRQFPLYFILKGTNYHYYFIWAETPWEFTVVHSMGSSIHNRHNFNPETFANIVDCLQTQATRAE